MALKNFNKINLQQKIILNLVILFLVIGGLTYFVSLPAINSIKKIKSEIEEQRIDLEKKYMRGQSLKKLAENLKKIEPELEKLEQIFIKTEEALGFITSLENLSDTSNINQKINLITPKNQPNEGGYKKIPLQLLASGNFFNQMRYLINIESSKYYINVKSLEMTASAQPIQKQTRQEEGAPVEEEIKKPTVDILILADTYWK